MVANFIHRGIQIQLSSSPISLCKELDSGEMSIEEQDNQGLAKMEETMVSAHKTMEKA